MTESASHCDISVLSEKRPVRKRTAVLDECPTWLPGRPVPDSIRNFSNPDAMAARDRPATGSKYPNRWYSLLRSGLAAKSGRADGWARFGFAGMSMYGKRVGRQDCRSVKYPVPEVTLPGPVFFAPSYSDSLLYRYLCAACCSISLSYSHFGLLYHIFFRRDRRYCFSFFFPSSVR